MNQNLLDSVSKTARTKEQLDALLKTYLSLGVKDNLDGNYLATLSQGIKLLDKCDNLNQFRQRLKKLKTSD